MVRLSSSLRKSAICDNTRWRSSSLRWISTAGESSSWSVSCHSSRQDSDNCSSCELSSSSPISSLNTRRTCAISASSRSVSVSQSAKCMPQARRARLRSSPGSVCVCSSLMLCSRFSRRRRNRYASRSACASLSDSRLSASIAVNVGSSERLCSVGSRPPRISWKTWTINSISRMPPAPSLMLSFKPRRRTSRVIIPFMLRRDWITLKSI